MSTVVKDLGPVTAYAYAVAGGYTGTEEEFTELLGDLAATVADLESLTVTVTTLTPGSSATASYEDGVLALGIPQGAKGDTGTAATIAVGTVTTVAPTQNASVTNTGSSSAAVFAFSIPRGDGVATVTKTGTSGNVDTYTMTSDRGVTLGTFTVTNGNVSSVNGKTGAVVLDAGDLGYDSSETYTSGSVGAAVSDLKSEISQLKTLPEITFTDGYYYSYSAKALTASASYKYTKIDVSLFVGGKIIGTTSCSPNDNPGIGFVDANDSPISTYRNTTAGIYKWPYEITIPSGAQYVYISVRKASESDWVAPSFEWNKAAKNLQSTIEEAKSTKIFVEKDNENIEIPLLRNGTPGNPGNVSAVTTQYIYPYKRGYDYLLIEFIGDTSVADAFGFIVYSFRNATDGMTTTQAMDSGSVSKYPVNDGWTKTSRVPFLLIQLDDTTYDQKSGHLALGFFYKNSGTTVPIRIASEQYCLRMTWGRWHTNPAVEDMISGAGEVMTGGTFSSGGTMVANNRIVYDRVSVNAGDTFIFNESKRSTAMHILANVVVYSARNSGTKLEDAGWFANGSYTVKNSGVATVTLSPANDLLGFSAVSDGNNTVYIVRKNADNIPKNMVANARHIKGNTGTPLTLLHLSDVHADAGALNRIVSDAKKYAYVDDMIATGDLVANTGGAISSWWDSKVMTCVGNHDTATYSGGSYNWTAVTMANRDAYYIAPFESNWSVTHTSGTSYYYKDYATQKVRLIVMDGMLYIGTPGDEATAQTTWLSTLLSDAITNNLHVIIAIHAPHGGAVAEECSFSRYGQTDMPTNADANTPQTVIDAVATAITGGLKFIGYLVGHTHQDNVWDAEDDGKQLMFCVTCAVNNGVDQWKNSDMDRSQMQDAYNLVTIDTANTLVKIVRGGGADIDDHMRTRKAICFDYSTGTKVGEVL